MVASAAALPARTSRPSGGRGATGRPSVPTQAVTRSTGRAAHTTLPYRNATMLATNSLVAAIATLARMLAVAGCAATRLFRRGGPT